MTTRATGSTARDFDFWLGSWTSTTGGCASGSPGRTSGRSSRRRASPARSSTGCGNEDEFRTDHDGGFIGMSFRFFDPAARRWSIYWADSRRPGVLDPPVFGRFDGDVGVFEGQDTFAGRPIVVRFTWSGVTTPTPRWEQAFSADGGLTWETNWVMEFTPDEGVR